MLTKLAYDTTEEEISLKCKTPKQYFISYKKKKIYQCWEEDKNLKYQVKFKNISLPVPQQNACLFGWEGEEWAWMVSFGG